jgi:hypothetical protein
MNLWTVTFQGSRPERPGAVGSTQTSVRADSEAQAWHEGQRQLEAMGWIIRERTGQAHKGRRVHAGNARRMSPHEERVTMGRYARPDFAIAKQWMRDSIAEDRSGLFVDGKTGEVNATKLAEEYAVSIGETQWLDDELHPIWEWALEVADESGYARNARRQSMEDATALIPEVVADAVIGEVESYVGGDGSLRQYADELADRARAIYGANAEFAKKLRRESGRDTLYMFMRHWLASLLKKKRPDVFAKLPRGYGWERSHLRLGHQPNAKPGRRAERSWVTEDLAEAHRLQSQAPTEKIASAIAVLEKHARSVGVPESRLQWLREGGHVQKF